CGQLSPDGRAHRDVHAAVRRFAHLRVVGARDRAAHRRQDHPAERELHRTRRSRVRTARAARLKPPPRDRRRLTHFEGKQRDMSSHISTAARPQPDKVLVDIVDYVLNYEIGSREALDTAAACLIDTLGCGLEALDYPACTK